MSETSQTWVDRLANERRELNTKIAKLEAFLQSESLRHLDATTQVLLKAQLPVMKSQSEIMRLRLPHQ